MYPLIIRVRNQSSKQMITWSFNYMCVSVVQIQRVRERPRVPAGFQIVSEGDIQRERETNRVPADFQHLTGVFGKLASQPKASGYARGLAYPLVFRV